MAEKQQCVWCAGTGKIELEHNAFGCGDCGSSGTVQRRMLTPDEAAYAKRLAGEQLYFALERTWQVIDAAGLHNLVNGVQLGRVSWLVKAQDAREQASRAMAKAEGQE